MFNPLKKACFVLVVVIIFAAGLIFAVEVIQTQESSLWGGVEVDLLSVQVRNNILTVKLKFRNEEEDSQKVSAYYESCYIMDETNQKKYFVLKDSDGQYIAGPKEGDHKGGYFEFKIEPSKSKGIWMKFPAPESSPETISLSIPGVFPFEEVEL
jgi:hypothetical protein